MSRVLCRAGFEFLSVVLFPPAIRLWMTDGRPADKEGGERFLPALIFKCERYNYGLYAENFAKRQKNLCFYFFPSLWKMRCLRREEIALRSLDGFSIAFFTPVGFDRSDLNMQSKIPSGALEDKWKEARFSYKLVHPSNKKKFRIIVVGAGLAGASAGSALAEQGYEAHVFFLHDSPRRAHSIAAQGGINAAKNYPNDGDSVFRLFYDTVKGGDFRSREANVYRLAQISNDIIDHCAAQGIPFAREYGGFLANRSFGGAQVSRTFYARGQTGQQLLLGAYGALMRQVDKGRAKLYPCHEMLELVTVAGGGGEKQTQGIITRNLITGEITAHKAHAVLLASGGYGNVFYLSTNAMHSNASAIWRCHKKGAFFANPCFTQIHPTCIPREGEHQSKLTLMSESLRNDGRVWTSLKKGDNRAPEDIPSQERDYYLERIYPSFGNLVPRDVASRQAKFQVENGFGAGGKEAVYLDFKEAIESRGKAFIQEKYGNLFSMYQRITGEDPYKTPMRIYPAVHYTMGGLWVDYDLQTTLPGLFALGEANFSDHGANRLGASALMQGLADGYFIIPASLGNYLSRLSSFAFEESAFQTALQSAKDSSAKLLSLKGKKTVDYFHRLLGRMLWEQAGLIRSKEGLQRTLASIPKLQEKFWAEAVVTGDGKSKNQELEKAGRIGDFFELAQLMAKDALARDESCGCHFRSEHQTSDHEALRNDKDFSHVSLWEWKEKSEWAFHKEDLVFEKVRPAARSYK